MPSSGNLAPRHLLLSRSICEEEREEEEEGESSETQRTRSVSDWTQIFHEHGQLLSGQRTHGARGLPVAADAVNAADLRLRAGQRDALEVRPERQDNQVS